MDAPKQKRAAGIRAHDSCDTCISTPQHETISAQFKRAISPELLL